MGVYVENNTLKISIDLDSHRNSEIEVKIETLLGKVEQVKTFTPGKLKSNEIRLDITELKGGVYNISVKNGSEIASGKFIK